jgi:hypothetical protein
LFTLFYFIIACVASCVLIFLFTSVFVVSLTSAVSIIISIIFSIIISITFSVAINVIITISITFSVAINVIITIIISITIILILFIPPLIVLIVNFLLTSSLHLFPESRHLSDGGGRAATCSRLTFVSRHARGDAKGAAPSIIFGHLGQFGPRASEMKDQIASAATQQITALIAQFTQIIMLIQKFLGIHGEAIIIIVSVILGGALILVILSVQL